MIYAKEYSIGQSSQRDKNRKDYFEWAIWIENGELDVSEIDYVEYLLHSTFKNRLRKVTDVSTGFKLKSKGWGEFRIEISITKKDGETLQMAHWLVLRDFYQSAESENEVPRMTSKKIYISHADVDTRTAQRLEFILTDLGMEVISADNLESEGSLQDNIVSSINASDAIITINSGTENEWQNAEIQIANELSKTIIPMDSIVDADLNKADSNISSRLNLDESYGKTLKTLGNQINKLKF
ncbi:pYEATS domain-containing protein [uncultured Kriegella sp.]|uniref:pYEATS domain-containing protein n=1 Tax=uncultured Kriegella sp. TaxID=1798910 RepID=UPI0030DD5F10|tara:strand:+ start:26267 stop:26986 length:720 start_codon:yes stop_codon:yes gene_type:complete